MGFAVGMQHDVYLVRFELDGVWHTAKTESGKDIKCGGRDGFKNACKRATEEGRAMKWAHMTAVCRVGDESSPILHRTAENNFSL